MKKIILFNVSILLSFFAHSSDLEKKEQDSYLLSLFAHYLEENWQALEQSMFRFLDADMDEEKSNDIIKPTKGICK